MQTAVSLNAAFERNVTVDIIRKIILEVDYRFVEQQNILRVSYAQLSDRLDQLRCKAQILASATGGANANSDYLAVSQTAHNTCTPNANMSSKNECRSLQNSANAVLAMDALTALHSDADAHKSDTDEGGTGVSGDGGGGTSSISCMRNQFNTSFPTDHTDLARVMESSTPKAFASMRHLNQANLGAAQTPHEMGTSTMTTMSAHRVSPSARSTPFFSTSHQPPQSAQSTSPSAPTHDTEVVGSNSAGEQGVAAFATTAKAGSATGATTAVGVPAATETGSSLAMSCMRMSTDISTSAGGGQTDNTFSYLHAHCDRDGDTGGGSSLVGTATPLSKYFVDSALACNGMTPKNSASSYMNPRHQNSYSNANAHTNATNNDWCALTLGTNPADSPLMASPQTSGKLSLDDLLARFSHPDQSGSSFNFDLLYEQLTGVKDDVTLDPSRTIDMGGSSVGLSDSAAAESTLTLSQQQQHQHQQLHKEEALCPITSSRSSDVIPIDMLRALHDQHLTTTIRAKYENGRPTVVRDIPAASSLEAGSPTPTEFDHLRINTKTGSQVLVEFKRKRVLQFESDGFVPPGQFVMVGGDRGEDLGLVIYTWAEVISKGRSDEPNTATEQQEQHRHVFSSSSDNSVAGALPTSREMECSSNDGSCATLNSGNRLAGSAKEGLVRSTIAASVMGIGLTGSTLIRSIGVGNGTVLRLASEADVQQLHATQAELERRAVDVCTQRVLEHGLPMTILDAEYQFDKKKLTFFYEAQQRLDFRELVRDLYKTFRARIWMELVESQRCVHTQM